MMTEQELEQNINDIPPLPVAVTEAMRLLDAEEVDFAKLQAAIAKDAGLSSRILSVANSPFYGMDGKISSIKESCVILGTHTLRNIVIAAGMIGRFPPTAGNLFDLKELWRHSYGTGMAARLLSVYCGVDQEKAFTAGLLHDIGKMVLDVYFQQDYLQVMQYREQADCLLSEAEKHVLGFDHSTVGRMITRRWNLPEEIINAIQGHHQLNNNNDDALSAVVHVADIVSRALDIGDAGDTMIPELDETVMQSLGLTFEHIQNDLYKIESAVESASDILG